MAEEADDELDVFFKFYSYEWTIENINPLRGCRKSLTFPIGGVECQDEFIISINLSTEGLVEVEIKIVAKIDKVKGNCFAVAVLDKTGNVLEEKHGSMEEVSSIFEEAVTDLNSSTTDSNLHHTREKGETSEFYREKDNVSLFSFLPTDKNAHYSTENMSSNEKEKKHEVNKQATTETISDIKKPIMNEKEIKQEEYKNTGKSAFRYKSIFEEIPVNKMEFTENLKFNAKKFIFQNTFSIRCGLGIKFQRCISSQLEAGTYFFNLLTPNKESSQGLRNLSNDLERVFKENIKFSDAIAQLNYKSFKAHKALIFCRCPSLLSNFRNSEVMLKKSDTETSSNGQGKANFSLDYYILKVCCSTKYLLENYKSNFEGKQFKTVNEHKNNIQKSAEETEQNSIEQDSFLMTAVRKYTFITAERVTDICDAYSCINSTPEGELIDSNKETREFQDIKRSTEYGNELTEEKDETISKNTICFRDSIKNVTLENLEFQENNSDAIDISSLMDEIKTDNNDLVKSGCTSKDKIRMKEKHEGNQIVPAIGKSCQTDKFLYANLKSPPSYNFEKESNDSAHVFKELNISANADDQLLSTSQGFRSSNVISEIPNSEFDLSKLKYSSHSNFDKNSEKDRMCNKSSQSYDDEMKMKQSLTDLEKIEMFPTNTSPVLTGVQDIPARSQQAHRGSRTKKLSFLAGKKPLNTQKRFLHNDILYNTDSDEPTQNKDSSNKELRVVKCISPLPISSSSFFNLEYPETDNLSVSDSTEEKNFSNPVGLSDDDNIISVTHLSPFKSEECEIKSNSDFCSDLENIRKTNDTLYNTGSDVPTQNKDSSNEETLHKCDNRKQIERLSPFSISSSSSFNLEYSETDHSNISDNKEERNISDTVELSNGDKFSATNCSPLESEDSEVKSESSFCSDSKNIYDGVKFLFSPVTVQRDSSSFDTEQSRTTKSNHSFDSSRSSSLSDWDYNNSLGNISVSSGSEHNEDLHEKVKKYQNSSSSKCTNEDENSLHLIDIDPHAFYWILRYIYTEKLDLNNPLLFQLTCFRVYKYAVKFGLTQLAELLAPQTTHVKTLIKTVKFSFLWTIHEFTEWMTYKSPNFVAVGSKTIWNVFLHRNQNILVLNLKSRGGLVSNMQYSFTLIIQENSRIHNIKSKPQLFNLFDETDVHINLNKLKISAGNIDSIKIYCDIILEDGDFVVEYETFSPSWLPKFNPVNLSKDLGNLFKSKKYCDVSLRVENQLFPAHRFILASRSSTFDSLLKNCDENILDIEDIDGSTLEKLLEFMYTAQMQDSKVDWRLYEAAINYRFQDLEKICRRSLIRNLSKQDVPKVFLLAHKVNDFGLKSCAKTYICRNASDILLSPSGLDLITNHSDIAKEIFNELSTRY